MNELTLEDSQPVELYEFSSPYNTYYYTSDVISWNIDSHDYLPISGLERGAILIGTHENDKDSLKIKIPLSTDVAQDWAFDVTPPNLLITIKRLDRAGGGTYTIWKGKVSSVSVEKHLVVFNCPSRFSAILNAKVPTVNVQQQCNHILFDNRCQVVRADYSFTAEVTAINGRTITLDNDEASDDDDFTNGEILVLSTGERKTISSKGGYTVTTIYELIVEVGDTVEITQGCNHLRDSTQGCQKFNNKPNYGGFLYIAGEDKNPFQVGIV